MDNNVPFFEECLAVCHVFADGGRFPRPVRARWINLIERLTPMPIPPSDQQRYPVRSHTTERSASPQTRDDPTPSDRHMRVFSVWVLMKRRLTPIVSPSASPPPPPAPTPSWADTRHTPSSMLVRSCAPSRPGHGSRDPFQSRRSRYWGIWGRLSRVRRCRRGLTGLSFLLQGRRRWWLLVSMWATTGP